VREHTAACLKMAADSFIVPAGGLQSLASVKARYDDIGHTLNGPFTDRGVEEALIFMQQHYQGSSFCLSMSCFRLRKKFVNIA